MNRLRAFVRIFSASVLAVLFIILLLPAALRGEKAVMGPKICLTMIVRNESAIIERCLNSVKEIVDCISICDTGSTDDTPQIIKKYIQQLGIPGQVHHHKWENFGHNRTLSVEVAKQWLQENNFSLNDTFLLLIDADMLLEVGPDFKKNELTADSYLMTQNSSTLSHYNTRLIRASLPWKCVGVTHEYWTCMIPRRDAKITSLQIDDRNDGGFKSDKFERDVSMLTQGLKDEPDNERYMFYLANSYECLKNYDEAISWYKKRISRGGWDEEVWYSKYMIGRCYEEAGQWDHALASYLDAYDFKPDRAEPIYQISKHYRLNLQHHLAYSFAKMGAAIPYPDDQVLFISHPVYNYLFDEDISISAFYTPYREEGFAAANRLVLNKNAPYYIKEQAYRNMLYYLPILKDAEYKAISVATPPIKEGFSVCYNPLNPSIKKTSEGYDVICRTVNYTQIGAKHFQSLDIFDPTNIIKTRNFLVKYDTDLNILSQKEIVENLPRQKRKSYNIEGLEDCRIIEYKGATWFTCTTLDTNPCGQPQISLCKLSSDHSFDTVQVESLIPMLGPNPKRCEKNWLPFIKDGELHMIYSYDPFIVYRPRIDGEFSIIRDELISYNRIPAYDFSRFSGSAAPIEFDDGYLMLVHETIFDDKRNYLHRFLFMDKDLNITKVSKSFIYLHTGIEYCCGMAIDHSNSKLLMGVGIEDREAYLCIVSLDTVRDMLEDLELIYPSVKVKKEGKVLVTAN